MRNWYLNNYKKEGEKSLHVLTGDAKKLCCVQVDPFKGVLHPWALFLKILCIFSKNKATSDNVSYGFGQKCSKELKNHSFTSVETIVVKLQWKMCENQYFPCFEP